MSTYEPCPGAGTTIPRNADTRWGNTICPECRGIANVDTEDNTIDPHGVLVALAPEPDCEGHTAGTECHDPRPDGSPCWVCDMAQDEQDAAA